MYNNACVLGLYGPQCHRHAAYYTTTSYWEVFCGTGGAVGSEESHVGNAVVAACEVVMCVCYQQALAWWCTTRCTTSVLSCC